jgi:hypothetical protein
MELEQIIAEKVEGIYEACLLENVLNESVANIEIGHNIANRLMGFISQNVNPSKIKELSLYAEKLQQWSVFKQMLKTLGSLNKRDYFKMLKTMAKDNNDEVKRVGYWLIKRLGETTDNTLLRNEIKDIFRKGL